MQGSLNSENENVIDIKARHLFVAGEDPTDLVILNNYQFELFLVNIIRGGDVFS